MKTLREVGTFVGIPQDSGEFGTEMPISLGYVRHLLTGSPFVGSSGDAQPFSMQAAIQQLQGLPPIKLDANVIGSREGDEPFAPVIRIGSSPGVIISTRIHYESGGRTWGVSENVGAAGGDVGGLTLSPGSWTLTVRRAGIGATGYMKLEKALHLRVRRSGPSGEETPIRPTIEVTHEFEGVNVTFTVTGQGFLANQPRNLEGITIRIVDGWNFQNYAHFYTGSDENGAIHAEIGPLDVRRLTLNFGIRRVHVSATDSRKDPNSVPANEPLWSYPPVEIDL